MKKLFIFCLFILTTTIFSAFKCGKDVKTPSDDLKKNEATWVRLEEDTTFFKYLEISVSIGHTAADCGNKCVKILGEQGHADCRGFGNACTRVFNARFLPGQLGEVNKLVLIDTELFGNFLEFHLPDRTFFISNPLNNSDIWLNIPDQLLVRENTNEPFVVHGIWFSEEPELENESFILFSF